MNGRCEIVQQDEEKEEPVEYTEAVEERAVIEALEGVSQQSNGKSKREAERQADEGTREEQIESKRRNASAAVCTRMESALSGVERRNSGNSQAFLAEKPSLEAIRFSANKYCKAGTGLFASWYFGEEALEEVLTKINTCQVAQPQSRFFLGLVQATMMGKTRLILELSKKTPLILIRLDNTNAAYLSLRRFVGDEAQKIKVETHFEDWQLCNRNIFNYIRLFFLSYLIYAQDWKKTFQDKLFGQDLTNLTDEIDLFNASLLNGGQMYVDWVFQREVESIREGDPTIVSQSILKRHQELSGYLNAPTFAIDECHKLFRGYDTRGLLFHSDYKDHKPQTVLEWQRHERFEVPSNSYPYKQITTLFSGFRWVLEEYLVRGEAFQTSIFASTFFSVWEPLLDTRLNARDKPYIRRIILKQRLELEHLKLVLSQVLQGLQQSSDPLDDPEINDILMQWCGRPGFFFDFLLLTFLEVAKVNKSLSLLAKISKSHQEAQSNLVGSMLNNALDSLKKTKDLKTDHLDLPVSSKELHHFLIFSSRLCGGNIFCPASSDLSELVAAGFVLVKGGKNAEK